MHNISKENIQDLVNQLISIASGEDTQLLLEKARELYEKTTILHYSKTSDEEMLIPETISDTENEEIDQVIDSDISDTLATDLSVQERIQQIMETAPNFNMSSKTETPPIDKPVSIDPTFKEEQNKNLPKVTIQDEFKDAISADYAADLFEKAEKIEITKKSLNDKLSQKQVQIGLNDRIAFVKHLFNGSQADFNRVLSQLNSFQTETQAKYFIESVVKPDYNWEGKIEYEERLIVLVERKFL